MRVTSIVRLIGFGIAGLLIHRADSGNDPLRRQLRYYNRVLLGPAAADIDVLVHTSQSNALRQLFEPLNVASLQRLNWDFFADPAEYCYFVGIECDSEGYITGIDLSNQGLVGPLPNRFADLIRLRRLAIFGNALSGQLPESLLALTTLNKLNAGQNSFSGPFPELQPSLTRIILDRNSFSGSIPLSLCALKGLEAIDLTAMVNLSGTLPDCLGSYSALTKLRITDARLGGRVPPLLCTEREMNGLKPNQFGCDAVACERGFYQRPAGRQTEPNSPCLKCDVPSNAIGSSSCHWHTALMKSNGPSSSPSTAPRAYPTHRPTIEAIVETNAPSTHPTTLQRPPSDAPSVSPSIPSRSAPPTVRPSSLLSTITPAAAMKRSKTALRSELYVAVGILIPASLCLVLPLLVLLLRICANTNSKEEVTDSTELLGPDFSRSTDAMGENLDQAVNNHYEASRCPDDMIDKSTVPLATESEPIQQVPSRRAETRTTAPSSCRNARRVAFNFPETIPEDPSAERLAAMSASSTDDDGDEPAPSQTGSVVLALPQQQNSDVAAPAAEDSNSSALERWFDSSIFLPLRSCAAGYGSVPEESTANQSPIVIGDENNDHNDNRHHEPDDEEEPPASGRYSPSTITMDNMELSSGDELEAVLGIRHPDRPRYVADQQSIYQLALALIRSADKNGNNNNNVDLAHKHGNNEELSIGRTPLFSLDDSYHDVIEHGDKKLDVMVDTTTRTANLEDSNSDNNKNIIMSLGRSDQTLSK